MITEVQKSVAPLLEVRQLTLRRGAHTAVRQVSFAVRPGETVAILGRSGAGKTTLMHALTGLLTPTVGDVHWTDQCVQPCCAEHGLSPQRRAVMFQHYRLVPQLSALTNVLCGRLRERSAWQTVWGFPADEKARARQWLQRVGLVGRENLPARKLSGGEQQRVAVARALIQEPAILLADEPVASLDAETANEVMGLFWELNRQTKLTVVCVLHDLEMAERYCSRVLLLEQGELVYDGSSRNLQEIVKEKLDWKTLS
ncbi:MAG: Lipoprotein-releasing system ATP-binding protein LolD [Verrucomicrobiae bacterium]|nr:Lipoprotein-releasing system ATP-binding protein LolD [Verrucomicrobiae bacterium]